MNFDACGLSFWQQNMVDEGENVDIKSNMELAILNLNEIERRKYDRFAILMYKPNCIDIVNLRFTFKITIGNKHTKECK